MKQSTIFQVRFYITTTHGFFGFGKSIGAVDTPPAGHVPPQEIAGLMIRAY